MSNKGRIVAACLLLTFCLVPAFAQEGAGERPDATPAVAWENLSDTLISWDAVQDFQSVTLTVSGHNGIHIRREFELGSPLIFDFTDDHGNSLPDGTYKYELRASPLLPQWAYDQLAGSREVGDSEIVEQELRRAGVIPREARVQSGWVILKDSVAVPPELAEPEQTGGSWKGRRPTTPSAAVVPPDSGSYPMVVLTNGDGVIRNSLCVGFDCPDSPIFDDSTILLMENNTRIKFGDTSNSPFPNNDWEIEANSNLSGGLNYLGFNDCGNADNDGGCAADLVFAVESGARASALYVEDDGDVGIGTSLPVLDLHIVTGNTPSLRLEQDGSSGFSPQTWDLAGNEANFFVRDVTGGSKLPLRIRPNAPTSSIDIAANGDIGIGTSSPSPADVKIARSGDIRIDFDDTAGTNADWTIGTVAATNAFRWSASGTGGNEMTIGSAGDITFNQGPTNNMTLQGSTGNVTFRGSVSAASKPFKIDHPLDPANKYLYHTAVESPDMINIYRGNVVLDENGDAWVDLPEWFEALNRDFSYQLTPIGFASPGLYVEEEISANRFKIGGGLPGSKVSWQVTGVRHDAWAEAYRIPVEELKPVDLRGSYLHPELFAKPEAGNRTQHAETAKPAPETSRSGEDDLPR